MPETGKDVAELADRWERHAAGLHAGDDDVTSAARVRARVLMECVRDLRAIAGVPEPHPSLLDARREAQARWLEAGLPHPAT